MREHQTGPAEPQPFQTFILKVANRCNIDCDYCYVFHSPDQSWRTLPRALSLQTAEHAAKRIADHAVRHALTNVHVVLHGGEPMLAGKAHIAGVLQALTDRLSGVVDARFVLQTNGTLISHEWLDLLERFRVRVGVSLDGPPGANDRYRLDHRRRSTWEHAARGIELLRARPPSYAGLLAVVDLQSDPLDVYDHLASFTPPVIDFNLPHATHDRPPHRRSPDQPEYGQWLSTIYDRWTSAEQFTHTIRLFEDIIALTCGVRGATEAIGLAWPGIVAIESDGSIEDVDTLKSVGDGSNQLGMNIFAHSFEDVLAHPTMHRRREPEAMLSPQCRACPLVETCGGGHLPHRHSIANGYRNPSIYCRDLQHLIRHIRRSLTDTAQTTPAGPPLTAHSST